MWILLPDEDTAPAALLRDPSLMTLFAGDNSGIQSKFLTVNAAVPKLDIASEHELSDTLKSLGITNAFSRETADFSALSDKPSVPYHGLCGLYGFLYRLCQNSFSSLP